MLSSDRDIATQLFPSSLEQRANDILDRVQIQVLPTGEPRTTLTILGGALADDNIHEDMPSDVPSEKFLSLSLRSASELATPLADRLFRQESNRVLFSPQKPDTSVLCHLVCACVCPCVLMAATPIRKMCILNAHALPYGYFDIAPTYTDTRNFHTHAATSPTTFRTPPSQWFVCGVGACDALVYIARRDKPGADASIYMLRVCICFAGACLSSKGFSLCWCGVVSMPQTARPLGFPPTSACASATPTTDHVDCRRTCGWWPLLPDELAGSNARPLQRGAARYPGGLPSL